MCNWDQILFAHNQGQSQCALWRWSILHIWDETVLALCDTKCVYGAKGDLDEEDIIDICPIFAISVLSFLHA